MFIIFVIWGSVKLYTNIILHVVRSTYKFSIPNYYQNVLRVLKKPWALCDVSFLALVPIIILTQPYNIYVTGIK